MYNYMNVNQIRDFKLYDITIRLAIMYKRILEYLQLQLFVRHDHLHIINLQNLKILTRQVLIYKKNFG